MDIKELSVGDWIILYNGKGECIDYTKVDVNILYTLAQENQNVLSCKPIPLTAEILEKNWFEMADDTYTRPTVFYFSKDRRVQVCNLTNSGDGYWCVHVDNEDFETIGSCDVQYVHEMQNLLRLCHYEMNIVL